MSSFSLLSRFAFEVVDFVANSSELVRARGYTFRLVFQQNLDHADFLLVDCNGQRRMAAVIQSILVATRFD